MAIINRIADYYEDMKTWRRHLHANPEVQFDCHKTAAFIAEKLKEFGVDEIDTGWAKTGVIAVIHGQGNGGSIGLRADMDALPMTERTGLDYASNVDGAMHACGHDGHTTMLLGAAKYLSETRQFSGRVVLFFQPAEEGGGGAGVMIDEGVLEKHQVDQIYALHNMPNLAVGDFETTQGAIMAAADEFVITISGRGGHAAYPHETIDPIVISAAIIQGLQSVTSRNVDPLKSCVVTVATMQAGTVTNIIADQAVLSGTLRTFDSSVKEIVEKRMTGLVHSIAAGYGGSAEIKFNYGYPATINTKPESDFACDVAEMIVGKDRVNRDGTASMGAEDFAYFLQKTKGAYVFVGNGESAGLHHTQYNFNDETSPYGASFLAKLVETAQPLG